MLPPPCFFYSGPPPGHQVIGPQIQREHHVELLQREFRGPAMDLYAGVVHSDVDAAVFLCHIVHHCLNGIRVPQVDLIGLNGAQSPQLLHRRGGRLCVHVGDDHRAPLLQKAGGHGLAQALGAAGDQYDLVLQSLHNQYLLTGSGWRRALDLHDLLHRLHILKAALGHLVRRRLSAHIPW